MRGFHLPEKGRVLLEKLAVAFTCGALGGFFIGVGVPVFSALGLTNVLGVAIHPQLTKPFLYSKIVWGGLWGPIMCINMENVHPAWKGCILGALGPGLVQLLVVFPLKDTPGSVGGLTLGMLTPLLVLFFNSVIWGLPTSLAFSLTTRRPQAAASFSSCSLSKPQDLEDPESKFS